MRSSRWTRAGIAGAILLALLVTGTRLAAGTATGPPRRIVVGTLPLALAVAPSYNRLFIVNSGSNSVSMLDARTGAVLGTTVVGATPTALAVDERTGLVFVANYNSNTVSVLDIATGRLRRTVPVGISPAAVTVAQSSGHVFVLNDDTRGSLAMLTAGSATLQRTIALPDAALLAFIPGPVDAPTGRRLFMASKSLVDGHAFVTILDTGSGQVVGTIRVGGGMFPLAVDARGNRLLVGNAQGEVRVLDATTGARVRTVHLTGPPAAVAIDAARRHLLLIAAATGTLTVLDEATGGLLRTMVVAGASGPAAVDPRSGQLYVVGSTDRGDGLLSIVDALHGRRLRSSAAGHTPVALALDAQSDRAFVVDQAGIGAVPPSGWAQSVQRVRRWLPWLPPPAAPPPASAGSVLVLDATP